MVIYTLSTLDVLKSSLLNYTAKKLVVLSILADQFCSRPICSKLRISEPEPKTREGPPKTELSVFLRLSINDLSIAFLWSANRLFMLKNSLLKDRSPQFVLSQRACHFYTAICAYPASENTHHYHVLTIRRPLSIYLKSFDHTW